MRYRDLQARVQDLETRNFTLARSAVTLIMIMIIFSCIDGIPNEPFIVFSNGTNINSLDINTLVRNNVLGELDLAVPLGYDSVNKHLYIGEHTKGRIYRSNYDGSSKTLIINNAINVEGVAIDWISRNIYWSSYDSHTIEVATLEGKYRKVLVYNAVENPRGIAVDPIAGCVFKYYFY